MQLADIPLLSGQEYASSRGREGMSSEQFPDMVKLLTFPCVRYSGHEMYVTITRIIIIIIIEVHRLFSPGGGGGGGFAGSVCCGGGGGLGTDGDGAIALAVACSSLLGPTSLLRNSTD